MKRHLYFSQWLILGIALILLGGAVGFNLFQEHDRVQRREQERLLAQAHVVEENAVQNLVAMNEVLIGLRKQYQEDPHNSELNEHLKMLADAMSGVRTLTIYNAAGNVVASNRTELLGRNFVGRAYFEVPRKNLEADMLYLSPPFLTVLGNFVINVTVAITGPHNEFSGIVTAALDPLYFSTLLESVRYAPDMRTSIIHWDGDIFMIAPTETKIAKRNLAQPGTFFTLHKDSGQATNVFNGATAATGEARMVVFYTAKPKQLKLDKPLVVTASRDPGEVYAAWHHDLVVDSGLLGLLALLSSLALYAFQRRQRESDRQLDEAADQLRFTHARIRESEEKYRAIIETTDTGYVILDSSGRVNDANREYIRLSGHARLEEIVGRSPMEWTAEHDRERNAKEISKCLETGAVRNLDIDYVDVQGRVTPVEINATIVHREASRLVVSLCRDISERKRSQDQVKQLAFYDALTNLPNRRLMLERLNLSLVQAKRFHRSLAIMFMDLDYFKEINDTLGHDVGDELLKVVAERLSACVRGGDTVSRQGGDEFVIVLTEIAQPKDATLVAEKIVGLMREPVIVNEHTMHVTISIGIAVYPVDGIGDPKELMKKADIAMYEAKRGGRNGFRISQ